MSDDEYKIREIRLEKEKEILFDKVKHLFSEKKPYHFELSVVNESMTYVTIRKMWNYFTTTNTEYIDKYGSDEKQNKITFDEYKQFPLLNPLFLAHAEVKKDHLIVFYLKNTKSVYFFYKSNNIVDKEKGLHIPFRIIEMKITEIRDNFNLLLCGNERWNHYACVLCYMD